MAPARFRAAAAFTAEDYARSGGAEAGWRDVGGTASGVAGSHSEEEEADGEEEEIDGWDAIDALIGLIVCVAGAGAALLLRTARRSVARALLPSSSPLRRKRRL